jgi:hypothetical protein
LELKSHKQRKRGREGRREGEEGGEGSRDFKLVKGRGKGRGGKRREGENL